MIPVKFTKTDTNKIDETINSLQFSTYIVKIVRRHLFLHIL